MDAGSRTTYSIGLVTQGANFVIPHRDQRKAATALQRLCKERAWTCVSYRIMGNCVRAQIIVPDDAQPGEMISALKSNLSEAVFVSNPEVKARFADDHWKLWSHHSVLLAHGNEDMLTKKLAQAKELAMVC